MPYIETIIPAMNNSGFKNNICPIKEPKRRKNVISVCIIITFTTYSIISLLMILLSIAPHKCSMQFLRYLHP